MAEHDLFHKVALFCDPHLLVQAEGPLDFLLDQAEYFPQEDIMKAKVALLAQTKNVDGQLRVMEDLYGGDFEPPAELLKKKAGLEEQEEVLREAAGDALDMFSIEDMTTIKEYVTAGATDPPEKLEKKEKLMAALPAYYEYAKFKFERGEYDDAYIFLNNYVTAIGDRAAFATVRYSNALWGRLAAIILTQQWHLVKEAVEAIDKHIMTVKRREDGAPAPSDPEQVRSMSDREKLQLRTWLLHWCLFAYPATPDDAVKREASGDKWENVLELIFPSHDDKQQGPGNGPDRYRQALQNNAPWLLRYVTTMVILHKRPLTERFRRKQDVVKEVVWLIEQEAGAYQDPITQFLQCLYVRFDFDSAQTQLQACYAVLRNDYFLSGWADAFLSEARQLIFETYCRIHRKIDINMLGQKLGMSPAEAEKWIVDLILDSKLVAKIDSRQNYVEMDTQSPSVYQQVLDRTERLAGATVRMALDTNKLSGGGHHAYPHGHGRHGGGRGGGGEDGNRRAQALRGEGGGGGGRRGPGGFSN